MPAEDKNKFCICALINKHAAVSENNEGKKAK